MRILLLGHAILPEETKKGHSTVVYTLSQELGKRIKIIVLSYPSKENKILKINNVIYFFVRRGRFPIIRTLPLFITAFKIKRKYKVEILHSIGYGILGFLIAKFIRVPFIRFDVGTDINALIRKKEIEDHLNFTFYEKFINFINKLTLKHADIVVEPNEEIKNKIIEKKIRNKRIYSIPHPIDIELFKKVPCQFSKYPNQVIFVGRIIPIKGLESLIRIARKVWERNIKSTFLIIGPIDDKEYYSKLMNIINELKISNVKFLGPVSRYKLPEYYSCAKIYAHTSHLEGTPQSVIEACACELPIVAFSGQGVNEIVENRGNGFLIQNRDENKFAEKLIYLLTNEDLRKNMGKKSREIVVKKFSSEKIAEKWIELYKTFKL